MIAVWEVATRGPGFVPKFWLEGSPQGLAELLGAALPGMLEDERGRGRITFAPEPPEGWGEEVMAMWSPSGQERVRIASMTSRGER